MKKLSIFILSLIQELIVNNWRKVIFIAFGLSCLYLSTYFEEDKVTNRSVINQFTANGKYVYVYESNNNYNFVQFDKAKKIQNGIITYKETDDLYNLFMALFIIVLLVTILLFFMGFNESDIGWEFNDCWETAFGTLISCEIQDNQYHYIIFDRLITIEDRQINSRNISSYLSIDSFKQVLNLPKFETRVGKRDSLLTKLGI